MVYDFDDLYFQILSVIRVDHEKGAFDVMGRPFAALSYRLGGSGVFNIDGKNFISNAGDMLFMPAGSSYRVEYSGGESIVVHFSVCNYHTPEAITLENRDYVKVKFEDMLDSWERRHTPNSLKSLIYKTLQSVSDSKVLAACSGDIARIIEYMNDNFADPELDISELCREFYTSSATLRRKFAEHLGISPKQYLLKQRLDKAIDLLAAGGHSVADIAAMCGFNDEKYFSRIVKERYGKAPSEISRKLVM